jgi:hypothetical protein
VQASSSPQKPLESTTTASPPKPERRSPSPPKGDRASSSQARSTTATSSTLRQTLPPGYPDPPPPEDPLGPAARPPYLPAIYEGAVPVYYSCRPGGPRLYDLLNTLSMEPFGVLSWFVIDKEEEIFECDDVRDEDKVMQALWARWILLNRLVVRILRRRVYSSLTANSNTFVADYYKGTIAFVDQYWKMIHLAAGWAALRNWLLVSFVTFFQVVWVLKWMILIRCSSSTAFSMALRLPKFYSTTKSTQVWNIGTDSSSRKLWSRNRSLRRARRVRQLRNIIRINFSKVQRSFFFVPTPYHPSSLSSSERSHY